jgi:hypothetical protein
MNGLGINKASKNDKDTAILTPDEVTLLRTHASDGTLTAEERELYSKHLEAMKESVPKRLMSDTSKVDVLGLRVARALITVALVMLALPFVISAFQLWTIRM